MADASNLPFLMRLLDDESEVVRDSVLRELSAFGPFLEIELSRSNIQTSEDQRHHIRTLLGEHARRWLREQWHLLLLEKDIPDRLERAAALIAEFQYGPGHRVKLPILLNTCASDFLKHSGEPNALSLATYLFKSRGFRGADTDYYNPFHSNLAYVIEEARGNPLSLCCVYMLVGRRIGLSIDGCNFPGHFLAKAEHDGHTYIVDCFNGGRFLEASDVSEANSDAAEKLRSVLRNTCSDEDILARMLRNLIHAYRQEDKVENISLFSELLSTVGVADTPDAEQDDA